MRYFDFKHVKISVIYTYTEIVDGKSVNINISQRRVKMSDFIIVDGNRFGINENGGWDIPDDTKVPPNFIIPPYSKIGARCEIGYLCVVGANSKVMEEVVFGYGCKIKHHCNIEPLVRFGHSCSVDNNCKLNSGKATGFFKVGDTCRFSNWFDFGDHAEIGNYCNIDGYAKFGEKCVLKSFTHVGVDAEFKEGCRLGEHVIIGQSARMPYGIIAGAGVRFGQSCHFNKRCDLSGGVSIGEYSTYNGCSILSYISIATMSKSTSHGLVLFKHPDGVWVSISNSDVIRSPDPVSLNEFIKHNSEIAKLLRAVTRNL